MNILIDTNVFISREQDAVIPQELQELENTLRTEGHNILIHPLSVSELQRHDDKQVREKSQSKVATYERLFFPSYPSENDTEFYSAIGGPAASNREQVDNALLYAVYEDQVDLLITEDQGIHTKSEHLDVDDRVLTISEGADQFQDQSDKIGAPVSIQKTTVGDLDHQDEIFDSLKEDYDGFSEWFDSIADRDAWVNWNTDGTLGAVLILKYNEIEKIGCNPSLEPKLRLKICTLKVADDKRGSKAGELLIGLAIREAIDHGLEEIYFTHYVDESKDYLKELAADYGFNAESTTETGEEVFIKRLTPGPGDTPDPRETMEQFYPSFHDGKGINKYLIPIQPKWHNKLFPTYQNRQPTLGEFTGQLISEANAIKKAYLTHANIRSIEPADILLFYRSKDEKEVTSLGICERVEYEITDVDIIKDLVGKRSVFSDTELREKAKKPTTVLLFKWYFDLSDPIRYQVLLDQGILAGPPQTIQQLNEASYNAIKTLGDIDERFIID